MKIHQQESKPIVEEFFEWIDRSPFFGKNAIAKAAEYTFSRSNELKVFLNSGLVAIVNNPAENAIRPNVIGRNYVLKLFYEPNEKGKEYQIPSNRRYSSNFEFIIMC